MKIAVLGDNIVTLIALDAILSRQEHQAIVVVPWHPGLETVRIEPSPLNELNFGYPGVEESVINFHIRGATDNFVPHWQAQRAELYKAGLQAFAGVKPQTSDYLIFESIKQRLDEVPTIFWIPQEATLSEMLNHHFGGVDAVINTLDRSRLCDVEDHTFILTRVWWSTTKGPQIGDGNVLYNAGVEPSWAISSNIGGRTVTIWDQEPPFDDIHTYDIPTKMACNCETPGIDLHLGRLATYRPITLAETYEQVVEFLHHPIAHLNDDTLSMGAIDGEG
jgi:hypothetical protein